MRFFAFTGEGKSGEAFTLNPLFHSFLSPKGEEVKAKSRKQRTRATCARWGSFGNRETKWSCSGIGKMMPNTSMSLVVACEVKDNSLLPCFFVNVYICVP